jgi:hypothetical protein
MPTAVRLCCCKCQRQRWPLFPPNFLQPGQPRQRAGCLTQQAEANWHQGMAAYRLCCVLVGCPAALCQTAAVHTVQHWQQQPLQPRAAAGGARQTARNCAGRRQRCMSVCWWCCRCCRWSTAAAMRLPRLSMLPLLLLLCRVCCAALASAHPCKWRPVAQGAASAGSTPLAAAAAADVDCWQQLQLNRLEAAWAVSAHCCCRRRFCCWCCGWRGSAAAQAAAWAG